MLYELIKNIRFNDDYKKIINLLNSTDKIVIKNKPKYGYYINYDFFGRYQDFIMEFVEIFEKSFDEDKIDNMLRNLSKLNVTTIVPLDRTRAFATKSLGYYDSKENEITIETDDKRHLKGTFFHELLHMASTVQGTTENYCGFNINNTIGKGINEDYTEYLLEKYFDKGIDIYPRDKVLEQIIDLVGEKTMEDLYFKADMKGLIDELSKYADKKEIVKILYEYDDVYEMSFGFKINQELERKLSKLIAKKEEMDGIKHTR